MAGRERELKLELDHAADFEGLTAVAGYSVVTLPEVVLEATYYDTEDRRLVDRGVTLRHRSCDDGSAVWTVKLPAGPAGVAGLAREEIDFDAPAGAVPPAAEDLVAAYRLGRPLVTVATLTTRRRRRLLVDQSDRVAELDDDTVEFRREDGGEGAFRELEVELLPGAPDAALDHIGEQLGRTGARAGSRRSKLARVLDRPEPDAAGTPVAGGREATGLEVLKAALSGGLARLLAADPAVRLDEGVEGVHQARVATRRLRSDLGTLSPFVDAAWRERVATPLKRLGGLLGEVRDADVLLARLESVAAGLDGEDADPATRLLAGLRAHRARRLATLLDHMRSPDYIELLEALSAAAAGPPPGPHAGDPARFRLGHRVAKRWEELAALVRDGGEDAASLHRIRIGAKRCRYAAESAVPVFGEPAARFASAMAAVQDVLGEHQDAAVAARWLRRAGGAAAGPEALVAGELLAAEMRRAAKARRRWGQQWDGARRRSLRKWLPATR